MLKKTYSYRQFIICSSLKDSDDGQLQHNSDIAPTLTMKGTESTSLELDYIPATSVKHQQHRIEEQAYKHGAGIIAKKNSLTNRQIYDDFDEVIKSKRKIKTEHKVKTMI